MIDPGISGKVALITGTNNPCGIGAGIAKALAAQGARVLLHYFRDQGSAETASVPEPTEPGADFFWAQHRKTPDDLARSIRESGGAAHVWEGDLAVEGTITAMFDEAERTLGPVDILVNNAAHWEADTFLPPDRPLENKLVALFIERSNTINAGIFDRVFAVNARGPALAMAEFAGRYCARAGTSGRIINISTDGAECFPSEITYGASKLALESYTRSAAAELGPLGITVNLVSLGPVQTGWMPRELEQRVLPDIPMRRVGTPEDVAAAVLYLASAQAEWVTGQRIYIGGGHRM
jgi:3-oxoacyl-[acyl-carrier protein] reductase